MSQYFEEEVKRGGKSYVQSSEANIRTFLKIMYFRSAFNFCSSNPFLEFDIILIHINEPPDGIVGISKLIHKFLGSYRFL